MSQPILASRTVAVIGSGTEEHDDLARGVGQLLARLGVNLLTGGGRGVMTSVSRAYVRARRARGISIGIIPCANEAERARPKEGYPNPYVELAIYTHLPFSGTRGKDDLSRNHINVLSSHAVIVLPGEHGTASEVSLALDYGRPVIAYVGGESLDAGASVPTAATVSDIEAFLSRVLDISDGAFL